METAQALIKNTSEEFIHAGVDEETIEYDVYLKEIKNNPELAHLFNT